MIVISELGFNSDSLGIHSSPSTFSITTLEGGDDAVDVKAENHTGNRRDNVTQSNVIVPTKNWATHELMPVLVLLLFLVIFAGHRSSRKGKKVGSGTPIGCFVFWCLCFPSYLKKLLLNAIKMVARCKLTARQPSRFFLLGSA